MNSFTTLTNSVSRENGTIPQKPHSKILDKIDDLNRDITSTETEFII